MRSWGTGQGNEFIDVEIERGHGIPREEVPSGLEDAGFVAVDCPECGFEYKVPEEVDFEPACPLCRD